jgi:mono/diheme cytochrome c family protein
MHMKKFTLISFLWLGLSMPALSAKLVDAPPPPPIPEAHLEEDGSPKKPPTADKVPRGQLLYENHCMGCHESVAQIRTRQQVKSIEALRTAVSRWVANTNLPWGKEEIEEVARYLGNQYYKFEKQSGL